MKASELRLYLNFQDGDKQVVLKTSGPLLPNSTYDIEVREDENDKRVQLHVTQRTR